MTGARLLVVGLTTLVAAAAPAESARAQNFRFSFGGPGVGGAVSLTYGAATDAKYPGAYQVTGISGTFTNTNNGLAIIDAPIVGLVPIARATPHPTNLLAPNDFSRFVYTSGESLSYTNLFWPGGSPQTATDYPFSGGFLDIYGLLFDIGEGRVVNLWSDGNLEGGPITYGAAVATRDGALDYIFAGVAVAVVPEPGPLGLVGFGGVGLVGVLTWRRRRATS